MPQEFSIGWDHTPWEVLTWELVARGWSIRDAKNQARRWLKTIGLWNVKDKPLRTLSGGQRRRATIATILATEAEVFFLDEPTVGLDVEIRHVVWKVIREVVKERKSIILTTHDMKEAQTIADKVILINKGVTIATSEPMKLIQKLPYEYRIIVRKSGLVKAGKDCIDLGDRLIIYAKNYREMLEIVAEVSKHTGIYLVDRVGLEDAYLKIIRGDLSG